MKEIYIYFWTSRGVLARPLMGTNRRKEGSATYQAEVNSVEYAPLTQRASGVAHMEHINPKESNKRQTRTQPHRDPNEQSDDMNPKKRKRGRGIIPVQSHGYQSKRTKQ
jgi:hypothetical protein